MASSAAVTQPASPPFNSQIANNLLDPQFFKVFKNMLKHKYVSKISNHMLKLVI